MLPWGLSTTDPLNHLSRLLSQGLAHPATASYARLLARMASSQPSGNLQHMSERFKPGDHLQVSQRYGLFPYYHHGIYVSDDRVIQFGPGITGDSQIEAVELRDFERSGPTEVVRHGRLTGISGYLFEADEPWKVVARAEFLLKLQPKLPYHLIGHNCEHIANMCASGAYTESHQVRTMFGVHAFITAGVLFWFARNGRMPRPVTGALMLWLLGGLIAIAAYNRQIKLFWKELKGPWFEHERTLEVPPDGDAPADS